MGEELDKPEKNYVPMNKENKYLKFGLNQVQGWKKSMEDYAIFFLDSDEKKFMNIFGIFDGHGGIEVPKYLSNHFLEFLNKNKNFTSEKYKEALTETFFELDKSFTTKEAQEELTKYSEENKPDKEREIKEINDLCSPNEKLNNEELEQVMAFNEVFDPRNIENANIAEFTGATGMILAICYRDILVANAGNSRCLILDMDGNILKQSKDHTMKDENEKKRVDLARSFNDEEEEKKKGEDEHIEYFDSTRGFGDLEFKGNEWIDQKDQEISVEPEILSVPYNKAKYIIFGSHGMFEGEDENKLNEEIGKFFIEEIKKNNEMTFSDIIKNYFENIIAKERNNEKNLGLDNMSCFFVELNTDEIKKFIDIKDEQIKEEKRKEEERKRKAKEEEMKRKAEERRKRDEEKKRKEEEKKRKETEDRQKKDGEIISKPEISKVSETAKVDDKKEEKKEEPKEVKIEEPKEEKKEEPKEVKIEEKKEEPKEEKKEEPKEDKKEEPIEVKIEEPKEEKKEEKIEEIKEEPKEDKKEESKEDKIEGKKEETNEEKKEEKIEEKKEEKIEEIKEDKKDDINKQINEQTLEKSEDNKIEENKIEKTEENKIEDEKEKDEEKK